MLSHLSEQEQQDAEERLWRYTQIARRIFLRKIREEKAKRNAEADSTKSRFQGRVDPT